MNDIISWLKYNKYKYYSNGREIFVLGEKTAYVISKLCAMQYNIVILDLSTGEKHYFDKQEKACLYIGLH